MKKLMVLLVSMALIVPAQAWYPVVVPPVVVPTPPPPLAPHSGPWSAGAAGVTGFIAFVAVLAGYDFARRWFCIGDPWRLGGPGFSEPMVVGNVKPPPVCGVFQKRHRKVLRVRG